MFLFYPVFFLLLSIAWTWPLATRLWSRIPHAPGDPVLNIWILWWNTQAVPFSDAWWSPPIFYPMHGAFGLSEHLAGIAAFTAPFHFVGLTPIAAYNVALILCGFLSGYFAFLLGRSLTGSAAAGLVAGVAFAIAPYRASQLSHLQVLTSQWMPLALFAMHQHLDDGRRRWLVLFAAAWLLQALSNGYYLLFFPLLVGLWLLWFVKWRTSARRGLAIAGTFAATSLLLAPVLLRYHEIQSGLGLRRSLGEMVMFSANLRSFIQPADLLRFWPSLPVATQEDNLFPGVTVVVLTLLGAAACVWRGRLREAVAHRSAGLFYAGSAILLWWLCLGPANATQSPWLHPYGLLTWLPGFEGLRVPARFTMVATLCISLSAAIAAARLAPVAGWRRLGAGALIAVGLFADGWIEPMPLSAPPPRAIVTAPPNAVVLELPAEESVNIVAMYRAILHRRPLVNGYSGYTPPHFDLLTHALHRGDPSILTHFARGRTLVVIVHRRLDADGFWRRLVEQAGGRLQEESGVGPVFVVPTQPRQPAPGFGPPLASVPVESEAGYAAIDLGSGQVVRAITVALESPYTSIGERLTVETSSDGAAWTSVWEDWTGEPALAAALEDHRQLAMKIYLPDVRARYLRISPAVPGVERGLRAHGPR